MTAAPVAAAVLNPRTIAALASAGLTPQAIQSLVGQATAPNIPSPDVGTPPGFNRQNIIAPLLSSAVGAALPDIVAAMRGKLPETSDSPGSKAILSEDLIPRLIEQERARQRFGPLFGLPAGPSAGEVYSQIRAGRQAELEELGARERALTALKGQIDAAIRALEVGASLKQTELQVGGDIKTQQLASLGDIQRQRVTSSYDAAKNLLDTALQNLTAPQNLQQSVVLQQLATQVP